MLRAQPVHRAPDFDARRAFLDVQDDDLAQIGQRFVQRNALDAFDAEAFAQTVQQQRLQ